MERVKILFSGHDFKFLKPIVRHYEQSAHYEVLIDEHEEHDIRTPKRCAAFAEQAAIIFCEWCLGNAVWYSRRKRPGQILVVRLHMQEMNLGYIDKVRWDNVDWLIFICRENRERFTERFGKMRARSSLIYNPIECGVLNQDKLAGAEFNLGMVGIVPRRKRPDLAYKILGELRGIDRRFSLYIKGRLPHEYDWMQQRANELSYYDRLLADIEALPCCNSVVFDPQGNDMPNWYSKIGFILSTSDFEGSHQAVAEGMASGAIPLIRNWAGADKLYPQEYIWHDVDEAVEKILAYKSDQSYLDRCSDCKAFAAKHFDSPRIIKQYEQLFRRLLDGHGVEVSLSAAEVEVSDDSSRMPSAMHICYIVPGVQNGYKVRVLEETGLLASLGHKIVLAVVVPKNQAGKGSELQQFKEELEEETAAEVHIIPSRHFFDLSLTRASERELLRPLEDLARAYQVTIVHGHAVYAARLALAVARGVEGVRAVFDCHGISPEECVLSGGHEARSKALEGFEKDLLANADLTVLVSERMREHFRTKYGLDALRDVVVPCCVKYEKFQIEAKTRERIRAEFGLGNGMVLAYLGTLTVWQWPEAMFRVFSQVLGFFPDAHFMLLLPTIDHAKAVELLRAVGLPEQSYSIREVHSTDVGSAISVADAGFLLREADAVNYVSSPTKFGEYLAGGVPVIMTSAVGDFADWLKSEQLGIVVEASNSGLDNDEVDKLRCFLEDVRNNREQWRRRCQRSAQTRLNWREHIKALCEAYCTIASSV